MRHPLQRGLHVQWIELRNAAHPNLGSRFAAALDEALAGRGIERLGIGHLRIDAAGLSVSDSRGVTNLANTVAERIAERLGESNPSQPAQPSPRTGSRS